MYITEAEWQAFKREMATKVRSWRAPPADLLASNIVMRTSTQMGSRTPTASMCVFFDVTGSMGGIPTQFVNGTLLTLINEIATRKSIPSPEILFGAIGDVESDRYPLQATEFNTDIKAARQLSNLCLEGGGGSNQYESYPLAWLFAARKTAPSCLEHGHKGILFTIGDEFYPENIDEHHLQKYMGIDIDPNDTTVQTQRTTAGYTADTSLFAHTTPSRSFGSSSLSATRPSGFYTSRVSAFSAYSARTAHSTAYMSSETMLKEAQKKYEVFHLCIKADKNPREFAQWQALLGEKAIPVNAADWDKVAEIIVSIIDRYYAGLSKEVVASSWKDSAVQSAVSSAIANLGTIVAYDAAPKKAPAKDSPSREFLITYGFSTESDHINNFTSDGYTPLTRAVKNIDYAMVCDLVKKHDAHVNATTSYGNSPLHIALYHFKADNPECMQIIKFLVAAGANLDEPNKEGITPRKLAADKGISLEQDVLAKAPSAQLKKRA